MLKQVLKKALILFSVAALILLGGCSKDNADTPSDKESNFGQKWNENLVPDDNKVWLFAGQDLDAIGGMKDYTEGYADFFGVPAGLTTYTNIMLDGIRADADWGAGALNAQALVDNADFDDCLIAIGLWCPGEYLDAVLAGTYDDNLNDLADFMKDASKHNFFLRIGYEFDLEANNYPPETYKKGYIYIVDKLRSAGADNFVSVWQSCGYESDDLNANKDRLMQWYPGDDYVDWLAYSYFNANENTGAAIRAIARDKGKPVMIAEATPRGFDLESQKGMEQWNDWFVPFINHIKTNIGVIKAVSYINQDWDNQTMWSGQGWGNTRLQADGYIRAKWAGELQAEESIFVHKSIKIDAEKEYLGTVVVEKPAPKGIGSRVDAIWGEISGGASVSADGVTLSSGGDAVTLYALMQGGGLSVQYTAAADGEMSVTIDGNTYSVPFAATSGDEADVIDVLDGSQNNIAVPLNANVTIAGASGDVMVKSVYIKPQQGALMYLNGYEIDVASPDCAADGDANVFEDASALSGNAAAITKGDGTGYGTLTFTVPDGVTGNAFAVSFAKGPGVDEVGETTLTLNDQPIPFVNIGSGDWSTYQAYIFEHSVKPGDRIAVSRQDNGRDQAMNIDGVFILELGVFNGSVEAEAPGEQPVIIPTVGTQPPLAFAKLDNAELVDNAYIKLSGDGSAFTLSNLPSIYECMIVYESDSDGTISFYANSDEKQTAALKKGTAANPAQVVYVLPETFIDAGSYFTIKLESGDVGSVTIKSILFNGGWNASPNMPEAYVQQWEGDIDGEDYIAKFSNFGTGDGQEPSFSFITTDVFDTFAVISASDAPVIIQFTANGNTFECTANNDNWSKFPVTYCYTGEVPKGTEVTVTVQGNTNIGYIFGLSSVLFGE